jgi:hypothetical protein
MLRFRRPLIAVVAGLMILLGGSRAVASPTIDYDIPANATGSIVYAGGASSLVGTNIAVDGILGSGTPLNSGGTIPNPPTLVVTNGALNFNSAAFLDTNASGPGTGWRWNTNASSLISITGNIPSLGITTPPGDLLHGNLTGIVTVQTLGGGAFEVLGSGIFTFVNSQVAAYFGMPGGNSVPYTGTLAIFFQAVDTQSGPHLGQTPPTPGDSFTENFISSGNVGVTVPAPSSLLLVGFGALGMCGYAWRRRKLIAGGVAA